MSTVGTGKTRRVSTALDAERSSVWARRTAVIVELLIGIGAFYGGVELLHDAEGFGVREAWLQGSPFTDYTVPALLLLGLGCGMILAALLALRDRRPAGFAARVMGAVLIVFISIETAVIGTTAAAKQSCSWSAVAPVLP